MCLRHPTILQLPYTYTEYSMSWPPGDIDEDPYQFDSKVYQAAFYYDIDTEFTKQRE